MTKQFITSEKINANKKCIYNAKYYFSLKIIMVMNDFIIT